MRLTHIFKATGLSGAEAHILTLSAALQAEGFDCNLLVLTDPRHSPEALFNAAREKAIPFEAVPFTHDLDLSVLPKLVSLLKTNRTQIVHTHMIHGDLYGTLAAQWAGRVIVQSRHNHDQFRRNPFVKLLLQAASAPAKTVIAISNSLADFTRDVEGISAQKIVCIHYGLDPESVTLAARPGALRAELGLAADTPVIAAVGRLTEQKGIGYLLEAFARVQKNIPDAQLVVAGDGSQRVALEAQAGNLNRLSRLERERSPKSYHPVAEQSGPDFGRSQETSDSKPLNQTVHFLGWRTDAYSIMADCDVLAIPSLWEGFGLVTLEAMALSKPVVASRVGALPEIVVDTVTGLLVPPADSGALAHALTALLSDPGRARSLGQHGRNRLDKEFSVQSMAHKHIRVYTEAASRVPEFRA